MDKFYSANNPVYNDQIRTEYKLEIRWPDIDDIDIETYPTKEALEARVAYLKTIPHCEGVKWKLR